MEFSEFKLSALEAARSRRQAEGRRPLNVAVLEVTSSTNDLGRRFVIELLRESVDVPDTLVLAYQQTAGRGRRGNVWQSSAGLGIYASLVVGIDSVELLRAMPMVVGVALAEELDLYCGGGEQGSRVCLKWPNDLLVDGRKLGGVLIESVNEGEDRGVVIGFGINHGYQQDKLPHENATSVAIEWSTSSQVRPEATSELPDVGSMAVELAGSVLTSIATFADAKSAADRYRRWSAHAPGDRIAFALGDERLEGVLLEIDDSGCLRIDLGSEVRTVAAGEVIQDVRPK